MKKKWISLLLLIIVITGGLYFFIASTQKEDGSKEFPYNTDEEGLEAAQENIGTTIYVDEGSELYQIIVEPEEEELYNK
ncbi:hypothetical protein [Carnobacterium sp. TMP28]|uniref:hypothetical protein n=1 Tax=Carnobacterium sp. TMP28 TaxID=3397060 RepID=UPI0039E0599F